MIKNINNEKDKVELQKIYNKNINYKNMLINNLGIIIILLSFILGIARAQHVQNTMFVTINNNDSNYILYMTTIAGIGLYDSKLKQASFKSWDTITDLKFNIKNKNSIETFLDSFRDYINKFSHLD